MKKNLNTAEIENELKGSSSFFKSESPSATKSVFSRPALKPDKPEVEAVTNRSTRRYSFEFYDDQIKRLKQMKYQSGMNGKTVSMSEIVRDALDDYLAKQD